MGLESKKVGNGKNRHIMIKNGQLLEWLSKMPVNPDPDREFVDGNGDSVYEVFPAFKGTLKNLFIEEKTLTFNGTSEDVKLLNATFVDDEEIYTVNFGSFTSRYALNFLRRLSSENLDLSEPIRIAPYNYVPKDAQNGEKRVGVVVWDNDGNKIEARSQDEATFNMAQPDKYPKKGGKVEYDFEPQAQWLLGYLSVNKKVTLTTAANANKTDNTTTVNTESEPPVVSKQKQGAAANTAMLSNGNDDLPF